MTILPYFLHPNKLMVSDCQRGKPKKKEDKSEQRGWTFSPNLRSHEDFQNMLLTSLRLPTQLF